MEIQVRLTTKQMQALNRLAAEQGISVAELIQRNIPSLLSSTKVRDGERLRARAQAAAGSLSGQADLAADHDAYLGEAFNP